MSFWSWLTASTPNHEGITPNENPGSSVGEPDWEPGDPDGIEFDDTWSNPIDARAGLPFPQPSPWDGWPASWSTPGWSSGSASSKLGKLVDTAWDCIDLNASVLSTMPVYRTQKGETVDPVGWMRNPDDLTYGSWQEFAKQLFRDYLMGEAFVYAVTYGTNGWPSRFRVIPPWAMHVEMVDGLRDYRLGGPTGRQVTDDILHIRYQSSTDSPRGTGPLDSSGAVARMVTIGVLQRYMQTLAETGGQTHEWIKSDQQLTKSDVDELQARYVETKRRNLGEPMVFGQGGDLKQSQQMSAKEMSLLELAQWNEARVCSKFRVPPVVLALPSGGDSMTYQNISDLFSFHDRAGLRPYRGAVMPALSNWALPNGQAVELNGDEYTRPDLKERAEAYAVLTGGAAIMHPDEARAIERLSGPAPKPPAPQPSGDPDTGSATSLSGGDLS